jgi:methyl-accepting chemotaxis protein
MSTLAQGKFDTEIEGTERRDEIGQMARTVLVFRDAGLEKVRVEKVSVEQRQQTEAQRLEAEDERKRNVEAQAAAAEEQASAVKALAAGLGRMSEGDLRFTWLKGSPNPISRSRTISTPRSASSRTLSSRSSRLLGTSAMPRLRSPPAPPTCRSGPRSRPPAWKRPPPRCRRFPRP